MAESNQSDSTGFLIHDVNIPGLVSVLVFYVIMLVIGIYASFRSKSYKSTSSDDVMLAGRNVSLFVGIFTMTATWVCGGYINGTAESVYTPGYGLVWCQAPVGYSVSLVLGGLIFAKKMRDAKYVTMLDPFERKYGRVMTALLYIPALLGDIFWTGATLSALGASLTVIIGLHHMWAVIISASIAVIYTLFGGLYSVAFTDVIQLICIFIGLWLAIPFVLLHPAVTSLSETAHANDSWLGEAPQGPAIGLYIDSYLLLIFGGIPWQVYFQRVLSQKTAVRAQLLSLLGGLGCLLMAIPPAIIGAVAKSTDWNQTAYEGPIPLPPADYKLVLPLVLQYLTPSAVAIVGLGAISAAVMSSADSSVLSSSSMFAHNVYVPIRDSVLPLKPASGVEIIWVMRVATILVGGAATATAIFVTSVYGLWYLCADLVYVILFPQLLCVVWIPLSNTYGCVAGYILGLFFRLSGGETLLHLPPLIIYPWYDSTINQQMFPFKTLAMLISFAGILLVSLLAHLLFVTLGLNTRWDIFKCFGPQTKEAYAANEKVKENENEPTSFVSDSDLNKKIVKKGCVNGSYTNEMHDVKFDTTFF